MKLRSNHKEPHKDAHGRLIRSIVQAVRSSVGTLDPRQARQDRGAPDGNPEENGAQPTQPHEKAPQRDRTSARFMLLGLR